MTDAYHAQKDRPVAPEPEVDVKDWAQFDETTLRKILPTSNLATYPAFKHLLRDHIWDNLTVAERYYALESGGVDNWGGYSDATLAAEEDSGEELILEERVQKWVGGHLDSRFTSQII